MCGTVIYDGNDSDERTRTAMVQVGDTFRHTYADGNFEWTVREVEGKYTLCDMDDPHDWGHIEKAFLVTDVERALRHWDWRAEVERSHETFWETVQLGRVLHYHNGFGEFVRGIVIERDGKKLLDPACLVGDWTHHWEYHWARLKRGDGAWQPSASCVYESPTYGYKGGRYGDPTAMAPLDLTDREQDSSLFVRCMKRAG